MNTQSLMLALLSVIMKGLLEINSVGPQVLDLDCIKLAVLGRK